MYQDRGNGNSTGFDMVSTTTQYPRDAGICIVDTARPRTRSTRRRTSACFNSRLSPCIAAASLIMQVPHARQQYPPTSNPTIAQAACSPYIIYLPSRSRSKRTPSFSGEKGMVTVCEGAFVHQDAHGTGLRATYDAHRGEKRGGESAT
ncbi:hypothetical protein D9615_010620 [Tricholomella constricta]|uniref:Uncharacterized protein n=1 Tax=Tricholomella constricta TaxID=117010 RepID=A0A8H5GL36_9AGAR|nr:hypothetical protein D9615_010620 [Tricholomella constricta]